MAEDTYTQLEYDPENPEYVVAKVIGEVPHSAPEDAASDPSELTDPPTPSVHSDPPPLPAEYIKNLEGVRTTLERLETKFDREICDSETRDSAVKTMYREMQEFKSGLIEKAMKNILYDLVDHRETLLSQIRYLRKRTQETTISLDEAEAYAQDLGDILEKYNVRIYKSESGEECAALRQKIIGKEETDDASQVKKVVESFGCGYEYDGRILYPERVRVYVKRRDAE